jgi:hypothetical protein
MIPRLLCLIVASALTAPAWPCDGYEVGQVYYGVNDYIEYRPGTLPLIISIPHGGYLTPEEISDRDCDGCTYVNDGFTQELGYELYQAIFEQVGCYPHLIINHLDRRKLDGNRNIGEAADGDALAEQAWLDFHTFISAAKTCVTDVYGKGFFVDLHGHGHSVQRIEYGYLLFEEELAFEDAVLNSSTYVNYSSLRNLVNTNVMGLSHTDLLRGSGSLGSLTASVGYPGVPSSSDLFPLAGQPYFSGGYNTVTHSSYQGGSIDGVQVECNQSIRFDSAARMEFAVAFAGTLIDFTSTHYNVDGAFCVDTTVEEIKAVSLTAYPNPGRGVLHVDVNGLLNTGGRLTLHDNSGRIVAESTVLSRSQHFCALSPGSYVLRYTDDRGQIQSLRWLNLE